MKIIFLTLVSILAISCSNGGSGTPGSESASSYKCDYINEGGGDPQYCLEKACKEVGGSMQENAGIKQCNCQDGVFLAGTNPKCMPFSKVNTTCTTTSTESDSSRICSVIATDDTTEIYGSFFVIAYSSNADAIDLSPEQLIENGFMGYPYVKMNKTEKFYTGNEVRPNSELTAENFRNNEVKALVSLNYVRPTEEDLLSEYNPYVHYYSTKDMFGLSNVAMNLNWSLPTNDIDQKLKEYRKGLLEAIELAKLHSGLRSMKVTTSDDQWSILNIKNTLGCYENCQLQKDITYKSSRPAKQIVHMQSGYMVRSEWLLKSEDESTTYVVVSNSQNSISYILIFKNGKPGILVNSDLQKVADLPSDLNVKAELL